MDRLGCFSLSVAVRGRATCRALEIDVRHTAALQAVSQHDAEVAEVAEVEVRTAGTVPFPPSLEPDMLTVSLLVGRIGLRLDGEADLTRQDELQRALAAQLVAPARPRRRSAAGRRADRPA
jgi:hypothetical protein